MKRISIIGIPGTGKTTLSNELSTRLKIPTYELDGIVWRDTGIASIEDFRSATDIITCCETWIVDGTYTKLRDLIWSRCDTVIWLDYSLSLIVWRITKRNIIRMVKRHKLWDGHYMTLSRGFFAADSVLRSAIRKWLNHRRKYEALLQQSEYSHVSILRFKKPKDTAIWLESL